MLALRGRQAQPRPPGGLRPACLLLFPGGTMHQQPRRHKRGTAVAHARLNVNTIACVQHLRYPGNGRCQRLDCRHVSLSAGRCVDLQRQDVGFVECRQLFLDNGRRKSSGVSSQVYLEHFKLLSGEWSRCGHKPARKS